MSQELELEELEDVDASEAGGGGGSLIILIHFVQKLHGQPAERCSGWIGLSHRSRGKTRGGCHPLKFGRVGWRPAGGIGERERGDRTGGVGGEKELSLPQGGVKGIMDYGGLSCTWPRHMHVWSSMERPHLQIPFPTYILT